MSTFSVCQCWIEIWKQCNFKMKIKLSDVETSDPLSLADVWVRRCQRVLKESQSPLTRSSSSTAWRSNLHTERNLRSSCPLLGFPLSAAHSKCPCWFPQSMGPWVNFFNLCSFCVNPQWLLFYAFWVIIGDLYLFLILLSRGNKINTNV